MKRAAAIIILTALICALSACGKKPISADYVKFTQFSVFASAKL